ncbi:hypothetical protein C8J56DRAFT_970206 [Mycena floridula]|nr:hypothetical protein C8J56DRAFT_970206 [Mycena floridula]
MKAESILPVHRPERQLAFNSKVEQAPRSSHPVPLVGRLRNTSFAHHLQQLWKVCTTTLDGSLSETFRLVSSDENSDAASGVTRVNLGEEADGDTFLDAVVVDNDGAHSEEKPQPSNSSQKSGHGGGSNSTGRMNQRMETFHGMDDSQYYQGDLKSWIKYRFWPRIVTFFAPRFPEHEEEYQSQMWHSVKILAFCGSLFLVLNWVLYLILNNDSTSKSLYGQIVFWGGLSFFTIPTPFMVALDMPRRSPIFFQIWFCIAVWYCAFAEVIQMKQCHFFTDKHCFKKDFLAMSYYSTGLPALMMFIVLKRLYSFIAQLIFFILLVVLIIPVQGIYARNVVSFVIFSLFIQGLDYTIEMSRRKMFLLAIQLKQAYRAKHKAKLAESKASFTKRRFANYIFHEVRVPLNNAVLAFQLLQSGNAFKEEYAKSTEIYALEQGLNMMKTVLNDVLDFEKMDSGHFETIPRPFPLHHSIRTILDQIEVQTDSRHLSLLRRLDERIDGVSLDSKVYNGEPEGVWVVGSELRLHQVLTNLATNAVKYTPENGGSVMITTEFLGITMRDELPVDPPPEKLEGTATTNDISVIDQIPHLESRDSDHSTTVTPCLTFRLEVQDSGPGIKPSDLVEDRLFQPFVQTIVGRASGGGTGLGLAIVKQIIRLSGGRLGVKSKRGEGSKFWIELSYPIASAAQVQAAREANTLTSPRLNPRFPFSQRPAQSSGFIPGPLIASTTNAEGTVPQEYPTSSPTEPSTSRSPMPPRYESNPRIVYDSAGVPTPIATPSSPSITEAPLSVLVVDDDAVTRSLSSKLLRKLGCVVETAKDGKECVDMVMGSEPFTYDLICLDNFMPVMTGEEAVKELRSNRRQDFIVGCTGNALTEDQVSYRDAGADEVMVKPVMIHDFKRLIQLALQRRTERQSKPSDTPTTTEAQ